MKRALYLSVLSLLVSSAAYASINVGKNGTLDYGFTMRMGTGFTQGGESQVEFKAPGAVTKYRLGNEADTNLKFALDYKHYLDDDMAPSSEYVQSVIMLDGYDKQGDDSDISLSKLGQGYISFNNMFDEGVNLWVGRRWYKRTSVYMSDHFWLNTGQNSRVGAGVEGINLLDSDMSVALFMNDDPNVQRVTNPEAYSNSVNTTALDVRLENIPTNSGGTVNFWGYYNTRPENREAQLKSQDGYGVAFWHVQKLEKDAGRNRFHMMYREGTAVSRSDFNPNPIMNNRDILDAKYLEVATDLVTKVGENWDVGFTALYRDSETTTRNGIESSDWYSVGIRPQYAFTERYSAVFELGHDYISTSEKSGGLTKLSMALQMGTSRGYWSRPVLRAFVTLATWSDTFKGEVGGKTFTNDTFGWSAGIQAEWWKW